MRVLFDIVHPAHVHFFRHLRDQLEAEGHRTLVIGRDKDVTLQLLRDLGIPHEVVGRAGHRTMIGQGWELVRRDLALARRARQFGADLILTRNPAGVQAARLSRVTGVFDTDDGTAAGVHFAAARPFAHVITSPDCLGEDHGRRHRTYPSYKALAYLHPNQFRPDPSIRADLGMAPNEPMFVVRFVAHAASHDRDISGLEDDTKNRVVRLLADAGRVLITSEGPLPRELESFRSPVPPDRMHDVLAAATLTVGDSQTVAAESAILGIPAYRLSSFSGRVGYLNDLERTYGLVHNFRPGQDAEFLEGVRGALSDLASLGERAARARSRLLRDKVDLTSWYRNLLDELVEADG